MKNQSPAKRQNLNRSGIPLMTSLSGRLSAPSLSHGFRNAGIAAIIATSLMGYSAQAATYTWDPGLTGVASDGTGIWDNTTAQWASGGSDSAIGGSALVQNTVAVASGNNTITLANVTGLAVGMQLSSTAFPAGASITAINGNVVTMSANATGSIGVNANNLVFSFANDVVFGGSGTGSAGTVTVSGMQTVDNLTIKSAADGGNYTFTSGTLTIGSRNGSTGNLTLAAQGTTTINSQLNFKNIVFSTNSGQTLSLGGGSSPVTPIGAFNGNITGSTAAIAKTSTVVVTSGSFLSGGAGQGVSIGDVDAGTGGLIVTGGTVTMGGSFQAGGAGMGLVKVDGGLVNVTGQIFSGRNSGSAGRVIVSSGTMNVTLGANANLKDATAHIGFSGGGGKVTGVMDVTGGVVNINAILGFNEGNTGTGASTSSATLNVSGGVSTIGTIQFGGYSGNVLSTTGTSTVNVSGGSLYLGTGGIINVNGVGAINNLNFSNGGTVGAFESWSTGLGANLLTGGVNFKAANASNVAKNITIGGVLSGVGGISKTGDGTLTLNGANSYQGGTTIDAGTVKLSAGAGATQNVSPLMVLAATSAASSSGANTLTLSAATINSLGLAVGQGVAVSGVPAGVTITAINTTTGVVTLSGNLTASVNSGTMVSFTKVASVVNGAVVAAGATVLTLPSIPAGLAVGMQVSALGNSNIVSNTYITAIDTVNKKITLSTPITGTIDTNVNKILVFGGPNQAVVDSTVGIGAGQTVSGAYAGTVQDVTGDTVIRLTGNTTSMTPTSSTFASYAGTLGDTTGTLTVNTGGTLDLNSTSQTVGTLNGTGGSITNSAAATSSVLTVGNGDASGSYAGSIIDGSGSVGFTKVGTGTQTLAGTSSYTGPTEVNGGKLAVNGSIASSVNVNSGGTLGGSGSVGGSVTVNSGGRLAAGNSISTTFQTGALTLSAGSTTDVELGTASANRSAANISLTNDRTTVNGALVLGGTLNLINNANADLLGSAGAGSYLIFTGASSVTGKFSDIIDIAGYHAAVDSESTAGNVYVDLNYYAQAALQQGTGGTLTGSDTNYTLNLGSFAFDSGTHTATITLSNFLLDAVYQDLLSGSFDISGKGLFELEGFDGTLAAIASGSNITLTVSFDTGSVTEGPYTGSILFSPTSVNASGTASLNQVSLGLEIQVVPEPATWAMIVGGMGVMALTQRMRRRSNS